MIRPNFFLVGAPRCGTTSMYLYLKQHPEIYLSLLKEPIYFGFDQTRQPLAVSDETEYLSLFEDAGSAPVIGEGSVFYLMSRTAAAEIDEFAPGSKILIMLRNPAEMMRSLHALYLRTGNEDIADFGEALAAAADRAEGRRLPPAVYFPEGLQYRRVAQYAPQVSRFLGRFGRDRVHITFFDDFEADTVASYQDVLRFLGVDPDFKPELDTRRGEALVRGKVLRQMRRATPAVLGKIKTGKRAHMGSKQSVGPGLEAQLHRELRPQIEELGALLGRDLSSWYAKAGS